MAKQTLNEAELLLVKQWYEVHLLQKTAKRVIQKYDALYTLVLEAMATAYPELDTQRQHITKSGSSGSIMFARKSWRDGHRNYPPGIGLDHLKLDKLSSEDEYAPLIYIHAPMKLLKQVSITAEKFRDTIFKAAKKAFTKEEYDRYMDKEISDTAIVFFASPSKKEILDLFTAGDEETFVKMIVGYFEAPARLLPALDEILKK